MVSKKQKQTIKKTVNDIKKCFKQHLDILKQKVSTKVS